jgi:pimeloyl-ACP methyl ester carboxylesterase
MSAETIERIELDVNGTPSVVLAVGDPGAPPLVYFHGAGTFHGADFASSWAEDFRVLMPFHPGYGESGDYDDLQSVHDLVLHYTELFDQMRLVSDVNLIGLSLGGLLAARFAIEQQHRLRRLVLCCPAGLKVPAVPVDDLFTLKPEEIVGRLVHDFGTIARHLPADPADVDFTVDRYREARTTALLFWEHPFDRVIPRWLGRVTTPSMVIWGADDRLVPAALAPHWGALLPDATVKTFPGAGHLVLDESADAVTTIAEFFG